MSYWKRLDPRFLAARRRWLLPAAATAAFALLVFYAALRSLFPYGDVARWIEVQARRGGFEARVEDLGAGSVFGVEARRITIAPAEDPGRKTELRDVSVKLSVLSLLRLRPRATLEAEGLGGALEANFTLRSPVEIAARWQDLDIGRAPLSPGIYALGLGGRFTGTLKATVPEPSSGSQLTGNLEGHIGNARLGPGSLQGLPLPGVSLGTGQIVVKAAQGRVDVPTIRFDGGNLDLAFNGRVDLPRAPSPGAVDGLLTLRPRGRTEEDLGFLLAFLPGPRSSDGAYAARVGGTPGALVLSQASTAR